MKTKRDHQEMEKRRQRAARLFEKGCAAAEAGRRLGVTRQAAHHWKQAWETGGKEALGSKGKAGRKPCITDEQRQQIVAALLKGPRAAGHRTELWTLPRVSWLIEEITGVSY